MAGGALPNPWRFYSVADNAGNLIWGEVSYTGTPPAGGSVPSTWTNPLTGGTAHRDAGCQWTKIAIGLGPDGTPNTSAQVLDLTNFTGDRAFTANQLRSVGLNTLADVATKQLTAF